MFGGLRRVLPLLDPVSRAQWVVSHEADHLEDRYGREAIVWVLDQIARAPKGSRARLYRLHDELRRRHHPYVRHH
jgi:hypothetical protein